VNIVTPSNQPEKLRTTGYFEKIFKFWLGYQRMKAKDFAVAEEDAITGELVKK